MFHMYDVLRWIMQCILRSAHYMNQYEMVAKYFCSSLHRLLTVMIMLRGYFGLVPDTKDILRVLPFVLSAEPGPEADA